MRMFIKKQIMVGSKQNFALIVPPRALTNEVNHKITDDLKDLLSQNNYKTVTSAGSHYLKGNHNFIFVLTPEKFLYLLIEHRTIDLDYLFIDEAHKISSKDKRSVFYYRVTDLPNRREYKPRTVFAWLNIPTPEVYLKLIPNAQILDEHKLTTTFSPVSQLKYLIDIPGKSVRLFNSYTDELLPVTNVFNYNNVCEIVKNIGAGFQNIVYINSIAEAVELAQKYANPLPPSDNAELKSLAEDICREVHPHYYLADIISKGVAYHVGYIPSAFRMRIEKLFVDGVIKTMFCTSTLIEGINLPADNLFVTSYMNGNRNMTAIDFKNLIGRVGRINYNLYDHVHLITRSLATPKGSTDKAKNMKSFSKAPPKFSNFHLFRNLLLIKSNLLSQPCFKEKLTFPSVLETPKKNKPTITIILCANSV
jgi:replicative superfamily II helicase